jgi:hypothetical protein
MAERPHLRRPPDPASPHRSYPAPLLRRPYPARPLHRSYPARRRATASAAHPTPRVPVVDQIPRGLPRRAQEPAPPLLRGRRPRHIRKFVTAARISWLPPSPAAVRGHRRHFPCFPPPLPLIFVRTPTTSLSRSPPTPSPFSFHFPA